MLTVHKLTKSFGVEKILSDVSFNLNQGERLGLVGPNGAGKTTLMRILAGEETPDSGTVRFNPQSITPGYLAQGLMPSASDTIGSVLFRGQDDISRLSSHVERLALSLSNEPASERLQQEYDAALNRLSKFSEFENRAAKILDVLGLGEAALDSPVSILSGGQKTCLALASALFSEPELLLLDEPTNHLDLDMLSWLEDWLTSFPGAVLMISHDRFFLDRTATTILELDPASHTIRPYPGRYSDYIEQKMNERTQQWEDYQDQQAEIVRLRRASGKLRGLAVMRRGGKADSGDKFAKGFFGNRSSGTVGRAKKLERRIERLLAEERIEKPKPNWQMKLEFENVRPGGHEVLVLENLSVGYGESSLLTDVNLNLRRGGRAALIGPNGSGKTTLLKTVAGLIDPLAGRVRIGAGARPGYMSQEQEELDRNLNALIAIRKLAPLSETEARAFLHKFLFSGDDVFLSAGSLSYGERARLSLACLVAQGCDLLLMDEPLNHLDIPSRNQFEHALASFEGTILMVVHDRYFIEGFASEIWEVKGKGIGRYLVAPEIFENNR